jgi:peptidoglycan/LPS O-acetylase OafA/YrhL
MGELEYRATSAGRYRADIDGLRAVAVIAVILYHLNLGSFSGGYVGVDVFFVISGFLITSLIDEELKQGTFSLLNFFERRIRRIFPALFALLLVCAAAFWFLLMPDDYKRLGQSEFASVLSVANFYFLKDSGYFNTPAAAKPLLHLWSLSAEEQFYLIFPGLMIALARLARPVQVIALILVGVVSLIVSIVTLRSDPITAFFLLHSRAWELMAGAVLALTMRDRVIFGAGFIGLGGLALIAAGIFIYTDQTLFPGEAALLPVAGTVLVILGGQGKSGLTDGFLKNMAVAYVGRISYSLYLWHFPIIAWFEYSHIRASDNLDRSAIVALSFVCACLSYHFVEMPFRRRAIGRTRPVLWLLASSSTAVIALWGLAAHRTQGFPARFDIAARPLVDALSDRMPTRAHCVDKAPADVVAGRMCLLGRPEDENTSYLAWGDSHAEALAPGLERAAQYHHTSVWFAGRNGCPPAMLRDAANPDLACMGFNAAVLRFLEAKPEIRNVILISRWSEFECRTESEHRDPCGFNYAARLADTFAALSKRGVQVWVIGPVPGVRYSVPRALYAQYLGFDSEMDIRPDFPEFLQKRQRTLALLKHLADSSGARLLLPHKFLCDKARCAVSKENRPLYFDDNHLTTFGAEAISPLFETIFQHNAPRSLPLQGPRR